MNGSTAGSAGAGSSVAAVGLFDGVHRGHQFLFEALKSWADELSLRTLVITFDRPPLEVIAGSAPPLIVSLKKRLSLIRSCGILDVHTLSVDPGLLSLSSRDFLGRYVKQRFNAAGVLLGFDNTIGRNRAGCRELEPEAAQLGLKVRCCGPFALDNTLVSSTLVREAVISGDLDSARRYLGRHPGFTGRVVRGKGLGATLGIPTANIHVEHEAMVPCGIYEGEVALDGAEYAAAVNIGLCPTFAQADEEPASAPFQGDKHVVEVHLLGFSGDLTARTLDVALLRKLREERKFSTTEALLAQVRMDLASIRTAFKERH